MTTTSIPLPMLGFASKHVALISLILFCCLFFASTSISAAQLYRYKDDQGNYVLNQTIPPKYVKKGYDILNRHGRVIRTVAPELTAEQIAVRDAALEKERLRKVEEEKQALIDSELKQLYSHPNEAVRVLSRRVQDIRGLIQVKRSKIETSKAGIIEEETLAAARQRQGLKILDVTLESIDKLKETITVNEHDILDLQSELSKVREEFDKKIRRLETITGKKASDYPKLLETLNNTDAKADQAAAQAPDSPAQQH